MKLRIAVQMDPIEAIKIAGDSTFALMLEAQKRGHELVYYTADSLSQRGTQIFAHTASIHVQDVQGAHFRLGAAQKTDLSQFDAILMRQDPPFDMHYITATHLLQVIHPKTLVVNDPFHVRNAPEKIFVTQFPDLMPPTLITRNRLDIEGFRAEYGDVVMKPLYGNGGAAVFKVGREDVNFGSLYDLFSVPFREPWVVQQFLPQVKLGDKRIILVEGVFAGALNRVPAPNDLRSNLVQGGAAEATQLSVREQEIVARIGPALRDMGLIFVGIDVIDGLLTEINVTSPTGIRAISRLGGPDIAPMVLGAIEQRVQVLRYSK